MDAQEEVTKLGLMIRKFRLEKNVGILELAEAVEQNTDYIARIEDGTGEITLTDMVFIADRLDIKVSQLFPA